MNAKELLDYFDRHARHEWSAESHAIILRALRLPAAAEGNDGSTPETDALFASFFLPGAKTRPTADDFDEVLKHARTLEQRCNALAARVRELEADIIATYDKCMAIVEASNSSGDECCISAVEKAVDAIDAARSK